MKRLSTFPFIASFGLFGLVAFIAATIHAVVFWENLISSDDPYIIGFFLACVTAIASLIYFLLCELKIKWLKPTQTVVIYYTLWVAYCLIIEFIGGEASGYGYFFLISIALSLPILILFIIYSERREAIYTGIFGGLIYFIGYTYVLSIRI